MSFQFIKQLPTPDEIKEQIPMSEELKEQKRKRDKEIQDVLKQFLEMKSYSVISVTSVKEALEKINDYIEVIIIDIQLPDGNGISLVVMIM